VFQGVKATMILHCHGVNDCFKYNSHSYLRNSLIGGNLVSPPRDGKSSTL
jgi:hypothetical protein